MHIFLFSIVLHYQKTFYYCRLYAAWKLYLNFYHRHEGDLGCGKIHTEEKLHNFNIDLPLSLSLLLPLATFICIFVQSRKGKKVFTHLWNFSVCMCLWKWDGNMQLTAIHIFHGFPHSPRVDENEKWEYETVHVHALRK